MFHYSTYAGPSIIGSKPRMLIPSSAYGNRDLGTSVPWPELVFLTEDSNWEPSVQAIGDGPYIKEASDPNKYTLQGIPCYKFEVELKEPLFKLNYPHPGWVDMMESAKSLQSNIDLWHWTEEPVKIERSYKWVRGGWRSA